MDHEHIWSAVTVGPDDHLVILLREGVTPQQLDQVTEEIRIRRPDIADRVTFVGGAIGLAVLKAEREDA